jgi:hypothetical protein
MTKIYLFLLLLIPFLGQAQTAPADAEVLVVNGIPRGKLMATFQQHGYKTVVATRDSVVMEDARWHVVHIYITRKDSTCLIRASANADEQPITKADIKVFPYTRDVFDRLDSIVHQTTPRVAYKIHRRR